MNPHLLRTENSRCPEIECGHVGSVSGQRKLPKKLLAFWWRLHDHDTEARRRLMELQRAGLSPKAASDALEILQGQAIRLNQWLQRNI